MHIELQERDDVLLKRSARGDEEAFTQLYRRNQAQIYRCALRMTGPWPGQLRKLCRDVFMTLVREPKKYDPHAARWERFFMESARNRVMKHLERFAARVSLEVKNSEGEAMVLDVADRTHTRALAEFRERRERVRSAVVVVAAGVSRNRGLCEWEERSYEEAAQAMECPIGHGAFQVAPGTRGYCWRNWKCCAKHRSGRMPELRICGRSENELRRICHLRGLDRDLDAGGLEFAALVNTCEVARTARRCMKARWLCAWTCANWGQLTSDATGAFPSGDAAAPGISNPAQLRRRAAGG